MNELHRLFSGNYNTPRNTCPFGDIKVADIKPAIMLGIEMEEAEIQAITACPEPPTFENTIVPLERSGRFLDNVTTYMYNMLSAETCDELDEVAQDVSGILSEHSANIMLNPQLFARVSAVKAAWEADTTAVFSATNYTAEDRMLLDKVYEGFENSGATLDDAGKKRFREITAELSRLSLKFSQNNLKETNSYALHLTDEADLQGLPELQVAQAAETAKEKGLEGWVITLHAPSYLPFMTYAGNRELRKKLYMAYNTKCTHDNEYNNFDTVRSLVNLRQELAQLLGYSTYAHYVLKRRMAGTVENVYALLRQLLDAYLPEARNEVERLRVLAGKTVLSGAESGTFSDELQPWDFAHYAYLLKKELYDIDEEMLRPYLELRSVIGGVFGLATKLYGITFQENKDIPVYHPDVTAYEVYDADGTYLAVLYADFHPRATKQGGAWMTNYKEEWDKTDRPHVAINANFTKPAAGKPALLTFSELETFLHEFGHALHGIFADTKYRSLSGTNVYWDFVELPSQFMENFAAEPDFLRTFARHYETGAVIPDELIHKVTDSRNFNVAYACIRQVSFGLLDMAYYTLTEPLAADIRAFERAAWAEAQLLPAAEGCNMSVQFGHIMSGGYSAGYYSYKWAEVLDADAFHYFRDKGIFNRDVASSFRQHILSKGGTVPPMELYRAFRGKEPSIAALMERNGITCQLQPSAAGR